MAKPFLTYDQQLEKLRNEKKLLIDDAEAAEEALKNIGYFSLIGGYKTPFINSMTRIYQNGATFNDILALYHFDLSLRELVFKYLCEIECRMRQLISYHFCSLHGEQQSAYLDPHNYNSNRKNVSDVNKLINILDYQANKNADHAYVVHQRNVYHNVPLWVLINTLTYGQISRLFALLPSKLQSNISKNFPHIKEKPLEQCLKALTLFRNVCAHNERLFSFRIQIDFPDTDLHAKLHIPKKGSQYICGKRDLFGVVITFRYLLPENSFLEFKRSLSKLIRTYHKQSSQLTEPVLLEMMGFPSNWTSITRYPL